MLFPTFVLDVYWGGMLEEWDCNPGKPILPGLQPDLLPGKMGLPGSKWVCNLNYRILDLL